MNTCRFAPATDPGVDAWLSPASCAVYRCHFKGTFHRCLHVEECLHRSKERPCESILLTFWLPCLADDDKRIPCSKAGRPASRVLCARSHVDEIDLRYRSHHAFPPLYAGLVFPLLGIEAFRKLLVSYGFGRGICTSSRCSAR